MFIYDIVDVFSVWSCFSLFLGSLTAGQVKCERERARKLCAFFYNTRKFIVSGCVCESECAVYQANKSAVILYAKQLKQQEREGKMESERERGKKNSQAVVNYRTQYNTAKAGGAEASQLLLQH